jgi:hypothetical protein
MLKTALVAPILKASIAMAATLKPGALRKMRHANRKFPQNSEKFQFLMLFSHQSRVGPNHSNLRPVPADRFYYRFSIYDGTRYKLVHPNALQRWHGETDARPTRQTVLISGPVLFDLPAKSGNRRRLLLR